MFCIDALRMVNLLLDKVLFTRKDERRLYLISMYLGITLARLQRRRKFKWLKNRDNLKRKCLKLLISELAITTKGKLNSKNKITNTPTNHVKKNNLAALWNFFLLLFLFKKHWIVSKKTTALRYWNCRNFRFR